MTVFEYTEPESDRDQDERPVRSMISVCESDNVLRMTIPAEVAKAQGITSADHMRVIEEDGGFRAKVMR